MTGKRLLLFLQIAANKLFLSVTGIKKSTLKTRIHVNSDFLIGCDN